MLLKLSEVTVSGDTDDTRPASPLRDRAVAFFALLVCALQLAGCVSLPSLEPRPVSAMLTDTADTRLGRAAQPLAADHPGTSGVVPLRTGVDAFAVRVLLADAAERSLDVQYYIWNTDLSGTLLLDALRRAAARGVRVRLLLDDNNTIGLDPMLSAFAALPNVEVRLFNPFPIRGWRALGFLTDFARLNRRMHNKSFTADNQATIVGGRNVGDEYFSAGGEMLFVDLDLLAIGPVVPQVSEMFDRYWASGSSYPALSLLPPPTAESKDAFEQLIEATRKDAATRDYLEAIAASPVVPHMLARDLPFDWSRVRLVSDDPGKVLGRVADADLMWNRLKRIISTPSTELILASAYLVPGTQGVDDFNAMAARGVKVTLLTNSLEATDVPAVHSGYAKRRVPLLRAGITLYELKRGADPMTAAKGRKRLEGSAGSGSGLMGSSGSSLHTKAFTIDGAEAFIGSFNFDPRSIRLNTEMGLVVDSPTLARSMKEVLWQRLPGSAYRVRLGEHDNLEWVENVDGREIVHDEEPGTTFWRRLGVSILSFLPIEWLL